MGNWGTYNSVRWGPIELILRDFMGFYGQFYVA